ncbi:MAG: MFS transporter [Pseudonocardiaceae bacterium]
MNTTTGSDRHIFPVLLAVLIVFTAQYSLSPVLAPLARQVGLTEMQLGLVLTVAAVLFAGTSLAWGQALNSWDVRSVLLVGLGLAVLGLAGFAVISQLALTSQMTPGAALVGMLATRSVLFGAGIGAVVVAAMAYVATNTPEARERTRGIGQLGAAQGVAVALGPALAGVLAFAGLLGPVWAPPLVVVPVLILVAVALPSAAARTSGDGMRKSIGRQSRLRLWDQRLWPFLAVGFLITLSLGPILLILGFLIQDRLGLDAAGTVRATGAVSFGTGIVLVAVQGLLVRRLRWAPVRLLRTGLPLAVVALLVLVFATALWTITLSMLLLGLGLGMAIPACIAAPTLLVGPDEQGSVVGLINAANGAALVVGPLAATALYQVRPTLPVLASAAACVLAWGFVVGHPGVRRTEHAEAAAEAVSLR